MTLHSLRSKPGNEEAERLHELDALLVLDTPPESSFDSLVTVASHLCHTPAAVMSFIEQDRQWLKATIGLDTKETPRAIAFCNVTIQGRDVLVVEDALLDPRFSNNPLVIGHPYLRFYAGAPLVTPSGHALGALAVLDFKPRTISAEQIRDLKALAGLAMAQLELRRQQQASIVKAEVERERDALLLALAGRIAHFGGWEYYPKEKRIHFSEVAAAVHGWHGQVPTRMAEALNVYVDPWCTRLRTAVERTLQTGQPFDEILQMQHPKTGPRWVRVVGERVRSNDGGEAHLQGAVQDITEQQNAQQAADEMATRLGETLNSIRDAVFTVNREWRFVALNRAFEQMLHRTSEQLLGQVVWDAYPSLVNAPPVKRLYENAMTGMAPVEFDCYCEHKKLHLDIRAFPFDQGLTVYLRDVTQQYETNEQLRLLMASVNHLSDVVMITDAELEAPGPRIVFVNAAIERMCGYRPDELVGRNPRLLQGKHTDPEELRSIRTALSELRPVTARLLNYAKDGREYWVDLSISPIPDEAGCCSHFFAIQRDVTERVAAEARERDLEAQRRQSQKLESLGTFAAGIAHDFNNILGAILGHVELARLDLPAASPALASIAQIRNASVRARALVQQIVAFGRRQAQTLVRQPLGPIVESGVNLVRATLPAEVRFDMQLAAPPLVVEGDSVQLEQVVVNLCMNAWQALEGAPGTVTVRIGDEAPPGDLRELHDMPPKAGLDRWAHLSVSDTGKGMSDETRARAFEPFFTTKPFGQGAGLGLPVVHGIVGAHGGAITIDSQVGVGTVFHVYLPARHELPPNRAVESERVSPARPGSGQRVLYVDDDEVMLLMMEPLLRKQGFEPTCLSDPQEAARLIARKRGAFDVVVTDFNMPEMTGAELTLAIKEIRKDLPVIILSGYVTDEMNAQARAIGALGPVSKQDCLGDLPAMIMNAAAASAAR